MAWCLTATSHHISKFLRPYNTIRPQWVNTLRPRRSRRHFADDSFRYIFLNENIWISIKISLKFIAKSPINDIPALVQIMAWRRPGDKPLFEPMMVRLLMYIWVARPQWVNRNWLYYFLIDIYHTNWHCLVLWSSISYHQHSIHVSFSISLVVT